MGAAKLRHALPSSVLSPAPAGILWWWWCCCCCCCWLSRGPSWATNWAPAAPCCCCCCCCGEDVWLDGGGRDRAERAPLVWASSSSVGVKARAAQGARAGSLTRDTPACAREGTCLLCCLACVYVAASTCVLGCTRAQEKQGWGSHILWESN